MADNVEGVAGMGPPEANIPQDQCLWSNRCFAGVTGGRYIQRIRTVGPDLPLMKPVAARLSDEDIANLAAFVSASFR